MKFFCFSSAYYIESEQNPQLEKTSQYQNIIPVLTTIIAVSMKMDKLYWDQPVAIAIILVGVYVSSKAVKRDQFAQ